MFNPEQLKQDVFRTLSVPEDIYLTSKDQDFIDTEISAHEKLLHTLAQRLAKLKHHRNSLSGTWRLPIEVLGRIMFVATQLSIKEMNESDVYPPPQRIPVPLILGQVCSTWRDLAWSLPELWATIPLAVSRSCYEKQISLLDGWLERAGEVQDLYIILTLAYDDSELQYFQDYPPRAVLEKLYKRSHQWHTFYSTLPNLCFQDLFKDVYGSLGRLDTLVLNRSGRLAFEQAFQVGLGNGNVIHVNTGGIHNLGGAGGGQGTNVVVQAGPGVNVMQNGVFVNGVMINDGQGMLPINITTTNSLLASSISSTRMKSPWFMFSEAPSLRTVILPESFSPFDIPLPWVNLTYLELRTISLVDCLHVLSCTPHMISFNFHGIFSASSINIHTTMSFFNHSTTFSTSGYGNRDGQGQQRIQLNELRKFSIFSDQVNLSRLLNALVTPMVYALGFKCTTGTIGSVLSEITKLGERSSWYELNDGSSGVGGLRKLEICVPSVGAAEEAIVGWLMSASSFNTSLSINASSGDAMGRIQEIIEELVLESWQADVAGLSDSFLIKMNPERRVRSVKPYSYPLDDKESPLRRDHLKKFSTSDPRSTSTGPTPGIRNSTHTAIAVERTASTDEIRDIVEQLVQVPQGISVQPHEILLPNLTAMTYRGALSFSPKVLKETIYTRWNRKSRMRTVPRLIKVDDDDVDDESGILEGRRREAKEQIMVMEEKEYFLTAELKAFDVHAPETEDLKELIDEETNLVFRKMLSEGFCLSIETKRGLMVF